MSPNSLGRKLAAEINLLELLNESRLQLTELEKNRDVAIAQHDNTMYSFNLIF